VIFAFRSVYHSSLSADAACVSLVVGAAAARRSRTSSRQDGRGEGTTGLDLLSFDTGYFLACHLSDLVRSLAWSTLSIGSPGVYSQLIYGFAFRPPADFEALLAVFAFTLNSVVVARCIGSSRSKASNAHGKRSRYC